MKSRLTSIRQELVLFDESPSVKFVGVAVARMAGSSRIPLALNWIPVRRGASALSEQRTDTRLVTLQAVGILCSVRFRQAMSTTAVPPGGYPELSIER